MFIKDIHMIMYIPIKYNTFLTSYESYTMKSKLNINNGKCNKSKLS